MINKASNHQKKNSDILLIVSDVDGTLKRTVFDGDDTSDSQDQGKRYLF